MRIILWITFSFVVFVMPSISVAKVGLPPSIMDRGGLFFPGDEAGTVLPAPLVKTDITVDVSGPIARYRLRHTFVNNSESWTEAIYTYPLPTNSAVDRLYMRVGDRDIIGKIAEKAAAKRQYDAAQRAGKRASLVEQHRPNIFSTSVANLGPGEHVVVEIGFQDYLKLEDGAFRLRMPLVVGPRYVSSREFKNFQLTGWGGAKASVEELEKITPPLRSASEGPGHPVALQVRLDAGFPIADISSPSHEIEIETANSDVIRISLVDTVPADRDFSLVWQAVDAAVPSAGLFTEQIDADRYALLMLTPPTKQYQNIQLSRDITFIIDTSGSMDGTSIDQAKAALRLALDRLKPGDRFQILRFSNDNSTFRQGLTPASGNNITEAKEYVSGLVAEGGTEIVNAVAAALSTRADPNRLAQVILITDGAVSDEAALFRLIRQQTGTRRFFTVAIGSAPNSYLMTRAANAGRGSYTYIQNLDEVASQMNGLFTKLETPALVDTRITWRGSAESVEMWPAKVPDLYYGEPLILLARLPDGIQSTEITGRIGDEIWSSIVHLKGGQTHPGVATLWGREKIKDLMYDLRNMDATDQIKSQIIETALKFQLVSRYTSLVAIDDQIARPKEQNLQTVQVPTNLPDGWTRDGVTGAVPNAMPHQKTRSFDRTDPALSHAMASSVSKLIAIPQTATAAPLMVLVGGVMTILACLATLFGWLRRRYA